MKPQRIGVDVDDVLYGWYDAAHALSQAAGITNNVTPVTWNPWQEYGTTREQWHDVLSGGAVSGDLYLQPPLPGALEALNLLRELGHTIHLCTARGLLINGTLIRTHTVAWIEQYGVPMDTLTFSRDKTIIRADWFVDDNAANVLEVSKAGAVGVVVTRPWNADLDWPWRVGSLLEFAQQLESAGSLEPVPYEQGGPWNG